MSAWAMALLVLPWACGGGASIQDVCEKVAGCTDQTTEECVQETKDLEQQASKAGCSDTLSDFVDCANDTFECLEGEPQFDCQSELTSLLSCVGDDIGGSCSWSCDGAGACTCGVGPNADEACCEQGTASCQASLTCENDCCE